MNLQTTELLQVAKELFPFVSWEIRNQFGAYQAIQFYDSFSLLRFSIFNSLSFGFSPDESEGKSCQLEDLEISTIKAVLLKYKEEFNL